MKLIITGDLVVDKTYDTLNNIDKKIINLFEGSEYNIVNLEAPITSSKKKILKTGPYLKSHKKHTLDVLKILSVNIVTLANNHIKDFEEKGVLDTIKFCEGIGVKAIGAGENITEASQTNFLNTSEGKIALINVAENEWSSADESTAGANGMSLIKDIKKIQQAKKESDFVFVIIHGGHEYYNLPSPRMKEQYRFYAEQGADLIVGHHTHCINGYEVYNGTPIYYSLGNFLFTKDNVQEDWYTGLILEVNIDNDKLKTVLHPVRQTKKKFKLSLLQDVEKHEVLYRVEKYREVIESQEILLKEWNQFVLSKQHIYTNYWSPLSFIKSKYISGLLRRSKVDLTNKKGMALFLNLMRCEAHYDVSKEVIRKKL